MPSRAPGAATPASTGWNVLLATLSSPGHVPVIAAARLRRGGTNSARGASRLLAEALATAKAAGAGAAAQGLLVVRADSAFYAHSVIAAGRRAGARFSVTLRHTPTVLAAIAALDAATWTTIAYPRAVWDDEAGRWVWRRRGRRSGVHRVHRTPPR